MNFWKNPENNPVKVIVLVVIIALCGYFIYKSKQSAPLANTGAVASSAAVAGACSGFIPHLSADPSFTATTVAHGTPNTVIAAFLLNNDSLCAYNLKGMRFALHAFPAGIISAAGGGSYTAPVLSNIKLAVNGVPFGATVTSVGPGPMHFIPFVSTVAVPIAPSTYANTVVVTADVVPLAIVGDAFMLKLQNMTATNVTTGALYSYALLPGVSAVWSTLLTIL